MTASHAFSLFAAVTVFTLAGCRDKPMRAPLHQPTAKSSVARSRTSARRPVPDTPDIPAAQEIEYMTAEAYGHILGPIVNDLPQFEVPKKYHAELLDHFRSARLDPDARPADFEHGSIRVSLVGGQTRRICWFWTGHKGRMSFSYAGMRYATSGTTFDQDETLEFDGRVRLIKREIDTEAAKAAM